MPDKKHPSTSVLDRDVEALLLQTVGMRNKCRWRRLRLLSLHQTAGRLRASVGQGGFARGAAIPPTGCLISSRRNRLSSASLQEGVKEPVTLCPLENLNTPENMPAAGDNPAPQRFNTTMPGGFFFSLSALAERIQSPASIASTLHWLKNDESSEGFKS